MSLSANMEELQQQHLNESVLNEDIGHRNAFQCTEFQNLNYAGEDPKQ